MGLWNHRIFSWIGFVMAIVLLTGMSSCDQWIETGKGWFGFDTKEKKQTDQKAKKSPSTEQPKIAETKQISSTTIDWINGPPPLPDHGGVYLYTQKDHPAELDNVFRYQSHNGWLILLDRYTLSKYMGYKMQVKRVAKTDQPNLYKIVVSLTPGGDTTQPAFCFFEVSKSDLPEKARIIVETEKGELLIG
ncbi:hypothetical protein [Seinonella peptonophila]|nr:hypothetical protein [Seinonella peptonophila]